MKRTQREPTNINQLNWRESKRNEGIDGWSENNGGKIYITLELLTKYPIYAYKYQLISDTPLNGFITYAYKNASHDHNIYKHHKKIKLAHQRWNLFIQIIFTFAVSCMFPLSRFFLSANSCILSVSPGFFLLLYTLFFVYWFIIFPSIWRVCLTAKHFPYISSLL